MTTENKTYTSTTAKITAERGNTFQADIMELADIEAEEMMRKITKLKEQYWKLHTDIAQQSFPSSWEQAEALAKLGQLAIAMQALREAYTAMNSVRCFS